MRSFFFEVTCYLWALFLQPEDLTVGLHDLIVLFQPKYFCDSIASRVVSHFIVYIFIHTDLCRYFKRNYFLFKQWDHFQQKLNIISFSTLSQRKTPAPVSSLSILLFQVTMTETAKTKKPTSQRPEDLIFQRQEAHSWTAPRQSEMQTKQPHTAFDYEGGSSHHWTQRFLIFSFQADLGSTQSTFEVEEEFRSILFFTIMLKPLTSVMEFVK